MSHNIKYWSFPVTTSRETISEKIDAYVAAEDWQEGASGLCSPIKWLSDVYDTRDEAEAAIENRCTHSYDNLAVQYYEKPQNYQPTKAYRELEAKLFDARKRCSELANAPHFANAKAEFVGCPDCKSKISRKHLRGNFCPVCRADMRPASTKDAIKRAQEKEQSLTRQLNEAEKKEAQRYKTKTSLRWLVRFEYHT